jgi:hypothetical protein
MDAVSPYHLAVLLWGGLVAIKLVGLVIHWRRRGGERLGRAFDLELKRRGLFSRRR